MTMVVETVISSHPEEGPLHRNVDIVVKVQ